MANKNFGFSYQGSKNFIAEDIIKFLPKGKRFVDLFGGGFAMSHCALLSNKYEEVLFNELNPLVVKMVKEAIDGKYNYDVFKPKFITRKDFDELKEKDGYVKYIWSFSNSGRNYLFGKDLEENKKSIHNYVVFDKRDEWFNRYFYDVDKYIKTDDIKARRILFRRYCNIIKKQKGRIQQLERLERLANLQSLQQLERLANLQITCKDYRDYEYREGDIVYCDPPYEDTADYSLMFNHQEFYEWLKTREYTVYFSSYNQISENFKMVWAENKRSLMAGATNNYNYECLYINEIEKEEV